MQFLAGSPIRFRAFRSSPTPDEGSGTWDQRKAVPFSCEGVMTWLERLTVVLLVVGVPMTVLLGFAFCLAKLDGDDVL